MIIKKRKMRPETSIEPAAPRPVLDRERIVDAALALLDEVGLDQLTMRRVAERLGVQAGALYRHVRDKDELLDLLAEGICAEQGSPDPALPWQGQIRALAGEQLRVLRAHRDAARILAATPPIGRERLRLIDITLRALLEAGFGEEAAMQASMLLNSYVTGLLLEDDLEPSAAAEGDASAVAAAWSGAIASGHYPALRRCVLGLGDRSAFATERRFAFGLEVLIAGLERQLALRGHTGEG